MPGRAEGGAIEMQRREIGGSRTFDVISTAVLLIMASLFLYPVLNTLALSLSEAAVLKSQTVTFLPKGLTLDAYRFLLSDGRVFRYYLNTVAYAAGGTLFMLLFTSMLAYPLTVEKFSGRKVITFLLAVTLFFSGGLIPYYLVVLKLGLRDTFWVMVLPGAISAWNVILFRTFFAAIPTALKESPMIDGAGHTTVLFRIILPLSKPLLATFALFTVVLQWNDFLTAVLFLRDSDKYPIQMLLRRMLVLLDFQDIENAQQRMFSDLINTTNTRTIKSAAVMLTIIPIFCFYPFVQKYFTKGIMIGSVKG